MGIGQKKQDRRDYSSITFLMGKFYGAGSDSCESLPAPPKFIYFPAASLPRISGFILYFANSIIISLLLAMNFVMASGASGWLLMSARS